MIYKNITDIKGSSVVFGVFDGLHDGHKYIINEAINDKRRVYIITFDIDPDELFVPNFKKLMTNEERIDKLDKSGVDGVIVLKFNDIKKIDAYVFLDTFFKNNTPAFFHVGSDFKFGANKQGNVELLKKWGVEHNMNVCVHDLLLKDGKPISSTSLRKQYLIK